MRLDDKLQHIRILRAAGRPLLPGDPVLAPGGVDPKDLSTVGHRSCHKDALPYFFEPDSAVMSRGLSKARPGLRYNFIGAHSYVNDGGYLRDDVLIGRYCSIGRRVSIAAGMHDMSGLSTSPVLSPGRLGLKPPLAPAERPVLTEIGSDTWIGDGAVILPGVRVGVGCIIGANAVVTKDTVPYGIYVGLPARLQRRRFPDATCEALVESRWWDLPTGALQAMPVNDVQAFLGALGEARAAEAFATNCAPLAA